MNSSRSSSSRSGWSGGFTLVELIVVVLVIVVLAAILVPTAITVWDRAYDARCKSNLRQIQLAISQYAASFKEYLPFGGGLEPGDGTPFECLGRELVDMKVLICPSDPTEGRNFEWLGLEHPSYDQCSYTWSQEAVEYQMKTVNIKNRSTMGLIADGTVVTNRGNWGTVQPKFEKNDRKAARQWVHLDNYVNFLFGDGHVAPVHIKDMPTVRSDPRTMEKPGE